MFAKCRLGAVCHYVNDVDRTEAFYRDVLGLAVQRMDDDGGGNSWLTAMTINGVELLFIRQDRGLAIRRLSCSRSRRAASTTWSRSWRARVSRS